MITHQATGNVSLLLDLINIIINLNIWIHIYGAVEGIIDLRVLFTAPFKICDILFNVV